MNLIDDIPVLHDQLKDASRGTRLVWWHLAYIHRCVRFRFHNFTFNMSTSDAYLSLDANVVRSNAVFINQHSKHVRVNETAAKAFAHTLLTDKWSSSYDPFGWWRTSPMHPPSSMSSDDTAQYILLLDALNFCFWYKPTRPDGSVEPDLFTIEYKGKRYNGYYVCVEDGGDDVSRCVVA